MSLIALHSPSCVYYNKDLYIAFYAGEQECVNQRVFIFKKVKNKFELFKKLPIGSGNPALMVYNNKLYCCYSMFTRPMSGNVFNLWSTTYTCVEDILSSNENKYVLSTYCCPRINPYYLDNESLLLPCYDESIQKGIIFHFSKGKVMDRYVCMNPCSVIQPSIVCVEDKLHLFFRNFKRNIQLFPDECYTPYAEMYFSFANKSFVFGETKKSLVPNHNESICAFNDKEKNSLIIYNAQKGRQELTMGILQRNKNGLMEPSPLLILNDSPKASYPNCCFNNKNQLVVVFSSYDKGINYGSSICIVTISTKYNKILSRKYITPDTLNQNE